MWYSRRLLYTLEREKFNLPPLHSYCSGYSTLVGSVMRSMGIILNVEASIAKCTDGKDDYTSAGVAWCLLSLTTLEATRTDVLIESSATAFTEATH